MGFNSENGMPALIRRSPPETGFQVNALIGLAIAVLQIISVILQLSIFFLAFMISSGIAPAS